MLSKLAKDMQYKIRNKFLSNESGQAIVEFAFCSVFLIVATFLVADAARLCFAASAVQFAAQEGARAGITGIGNAESAAREKLELSAFTNTGQGEVSAATIEVEQPDANTVQVTIQYNYRFVAPPLMWFAASLPLNGSASMIIR